VERRIRAMPDCARRFVFLPAGPAGRAHLRAWNAALGGGVQIDDVYVDPFKVN